MLKTVTVTSKRTSTPLVLDLWSPANGYFVKDIDGLGPVDSPITVLNSAISDGGVYQTSRRGTRNIVITLGLVPSWTTSIETLRRALYTWFAQKSIVNLSFIDSIYSYPLLINGYVEKLTPSMFDSKATFEISIICPDPIFTGNTTVNLTPTHAQMLSGYTINNAGTDLSGFILTMDTKSYMTKVSWSSSSSVNPDGTTTFSFKNSTDIDDVNELQANMKYRLSTGFCERSFKRVVAGGDISLLSWVTAATRWPMLYPGANILKTAAYVQGTVPTYTIIYSPRFGEL